MEESETKNTFHSFRDKSISFEFMNLLSLIIYVLFSQPQQYEKYSHKLCI